MKYFKVKRVIEKYHDFVAALEFERTLKQLLTIAMGSLTIPQVNISFFLIIITLIKFCMHL